VRSQQPDQFRGPFPSLFHLPAFRKARALARAWLSADRSAADSFPGATRSWEQPICALSRYPPVLAEGGCSVVKAALWGAAV
jgi:hypothetical protein